MATAKEYKALIHVSDDDVTQLDNVINRVVCRRGFCYDWAVAEINVGIWTGTLHLNLVVPLCWDHAVAELIEA